MLLHTLILATTASASCLHGLTKFKRADGEVPLGKFGYTGLLSPLNWPALAPENEACKTGTNQSPINIDETTFTANSSVKFATDKPVVDIPEQAVVFENLGTNVQVVVNGTTSFAGADFRLKQFHLHTPSEHRIGEEYFPLEAHFVHESIADPNTIAVVAAIFQLTTGSADPLIAGLQPHLASIKQPGTKTDIESLDLSSFVEHVQTTPLYQYTGSLTTPPCSEGLLFLLAKEPLPIDVDSFNEIKSVVKFNSRYTQNNLGQENLVSVANKAGTESQVRPDSLPGEKAAAITVLAGAPSVTAAAAVPEGETIVITEIRGEPTSVLGVVVQR